MSLLKKRGLKTTHHLPLSYPRSLRRDDHLPNRLFNKKNLSLQFELRALLGRRLLELPSNSRYMSVDGSLENGKIKGRTKFPY